MDTDEGSEMCLPTKGCQRLPAATKTQHRHEMDLPLKPLGGTSLLTPWCQSYETYFGLLASRMVKQQISVVLSHQVGGNLLQ